MKVILLQDVESLGKAGDLKDVANGYARNYLMPKKLAAGATPSLIANRQQRIVTEQRKAEKEQWREAQREEKEYQKDLKREEKEERRSREGREKEERR